MVNLVANANVTLQIEDESGQEGKNVTPSMSLSHHFGAAAYIAHIPDYYDKLSCSMGSATVNSSGISTARESLTFANSTSVSTGKPIKQFGKLTVHGRVEDEDGNSISPDFRYDKESGQIISSQACYADISVEYTWGYLVLRYMPESTGANSYQYGTIRSRIGKNVGTFQVPLPEPISSDWVEIGRVVSFYVIGEVNGKKGSYELPKNFPTNLKFEVGNQELEEEGSLKVERVHEIYKMDMLGRVMRESFMHGNLAPYQNTPSKKPEYEFKKGSVPAGYEEGESKVNWSDIKKKISENFTDIKGI
ncbi:MAG: hypothetical protein BWK79_08925 [Beggiatoa sp. IS2]|nr:MAG: hypothetical protein BWK79_08925 [Beggiatoa sp. IS2]